MQLDEFSFETDNFELFVIRYLCFLSNSVSPYPMKQIKEHLDWLEDTSSKGGLTSETFDQNIKLLQSIGAFEKRVTAIQKSLIKRSQLIKSVYKREMAPYCHNTVRVLFIGR